MKHDTKFDMETLKKILHVRDLSADGNIILNRNLQKCDVMMCVD